MLQNFLVPVGGRQVNAKASFLRYEGALVPGDETLYVTADGQNLGTYLPGDSIRLPIEARTWDFKFASAAQKGNIRLGIGDVSSARIAGSVRVIDGISDSVQTNVTQAMAAGSAVTSFSAVQLIDPAVNARGLILRNLMINITAGAAGGFQQARMWLSKTAPTSFPSTFSGLWLMTLTTPVSAGANAERQDMNRQIGPGWGLWLVSEVFTATSGAHFGTVGFELL